MHTTNSSILSKGNRGLGFYSRKCGVPLSNQTTHINKQVQKMVEDIWMAVQEATGTRCREGSILARQDVQRIH